MALTQKRMENCRKNHKGCIVATSKVEFVSKRLIEIHDGEAYDLWIKHVVFCEMRKFPQTMKQREFSEIWNITNVPAQKIVQYVFLMQGNCCGQCHAAVDIIVVHYLSGRPLYMCMTHVDPTS